MVEQPGLLRILPSRRAGLLEAQMAANIYILHTQIGCACIRYAVKSGVGDPWLLCNGGRCQSGVDSTIVDVVEASSFRV
jgi:hypothetical protein